MKLPGTSGRIFFPGGKVYSINHKTNTRKVIFKKNDF